MLYSGSQNRNLAEKDGGGGTGGEGGGKAGRLWSRFLVVCEGIGKILSTKKSQQTFIQDNEHMLVVRQVPAR